MAQQTINIGVSANDGSGDPLRTAFDKSNDNFTELYVDVAALQAAAVTADTILRSKLVNVATGAVGERFTFSSAFVSVYALEIVDYNGLGIEITAQDSTGFNITALVAGNFGYIAAIEV